MQAPAAGATSIERSTPRPWKVAAGIYLVVLVGFALTAPAEIFRTHTPFNHFALLADAWLDGRLDLGRAPPDYTQNNDFAYAGDKVFVSFPPFPALLLLPFAALARTPEGVRDGLVFLFVAPLAPAILYLALEKLRRAGRSARTFIENGALAILFAFGTVFWFSSVQGTVWFAAHAVGAVLAAGYLYASIDADHPVLAGICLGLGFATRTPLGFALPLFALELAHRARREGSSARGPELGGISLIPVATRLALFIAPVALVLAVILWHNVARFGEPFEFGHRYLDVVWRPRMDKWGLFSFHYLGKNLGVALASTPFVGASNPPFQVSAHGLALWITSPFYAWALWPRTMSRAARRTFVALALTAAAVALPNLLYQNTGWIQFGYRFSNDFAVFLFAMIALGRRPLGFIFGVLAAFACLVNVFGAVTFQRPGYERFYAFERTQRVIFEPD
jgi:hypothetical protein